MLTILNESIINFFKKLTDYLPNLVGGLLILLVGLLISNVLKKILLSLFIFFKFEYLFQRTKLIEKNIVEAWEEVLAEILKWTVLILFLIPTLEVWGLSQATIVLNQFLLYLPNVIIAVIIGFIGLIIANLSADLVKSSVKTMRSTFANTLSVVARSLVIFFTILVVMNQLGVAQDLIRILFTGIIAMIALAGGLAFGLGGQQTAKEILEEIRKKIK